MGAKVTVRVSVEYGCGLGARVRVKVRVRVRMKIRVRVRVRVRVRTRVRIWVLGFFGAFFLSGLDFLGKGVLGVLWGLGFFTSTGMDVRVVT